jgi:ribosome-binding protein aMBF1 (putative translation factor)
MTPRPQVRQPWGDGRERPVPEYRREHERTRLANDVAIRVIQYRAMHGLSQAELARRLGTRQPNVARLESGEHEPTIATLSLV